MGINLSPIEGAEQASQPNDKIVVPHIKVQNEEPTKSAQGQTIASGEGQNATQVASNVQAQSSAVQPQVQPSTQGSTSNGANPNSTNDVQVQRDASTPTTGTTDTSNGTTDDSSSLGSLVQGHPDYSQHITPQDLSNATGSGSGVTLPQLDNLGRARTASQMQSVFNAAAAANNDDTRSRQFYPTLFSGDSADAAFRQVGDYSKQEQNLSQSYGSNYAEQAMVKATQAPQPQNRTDPNQYHPDSTSNPFTDAMRWLGLGDAVNAPFNPLKLQFGQTGHGVGGAIMYGLGLLQNVPVGILGDVSNARDRVVNTIGNIPLVGSPIKQALNYNPVTNFFKPFEQSGVGQWFEQTLHQQAAKAQGVFEQRQQDLPSTPVNNIISGIISSAGAINNAVASVPKFLANANLLHNTDDRTKPLHLIQALRGAQYSATYDAQAQKETSSPISLGQTDDRVPWFLEPGHIAGAIFDLGGTPKFGEGLAAGTRTLANVTSATKVARATAGLANAAEILHNPLGSGVKGVSSFFSKGAETTAQEVEQAATRIPGVQSNQTEKEALELLGKPPRKTLADIQNDLAEKNSRPIEPIIEPEGQMSLLDESKPMPFTENPNLPKLVDANGQLNIPTTLPRYDEQVPLAAYKQDGVLATPELRSTSEAFPTARDRALQEGSKPNLEVPQASEPGSLFTKQNTVESDRILQLFQKYGLKPPSEPSGLTISRVPKLLPPEAIKAPSQVELKPDVSLPTGVDAVVQPSTSSPVLPTVDLSLASEPGIHALIPTETDLPVLKVLTDTNVIKPLVQDGTSVVEPALVEKGNALAAIRESLEDQRQNHPLEFFPEEGEDYNPYRDMFMESQDRYQVNEPTYTSVDNATGESLGQLFIDADKVGNKYQTPEEIAVHNEAMSKAVNGIGNEIDRQSPEGTSNDAVDEHVNNLAANYKGDTAHTDKLKELFAKIQSKLTTINEAKSNAISDSLAEVPKQETTLHPQDIEQFRQELPVVEPRVFTGSMTLAEFAKQLAEHIPGSQVNGEALVQKPRTLDDMAALARIIPGEDGLPLVSQSVKRPFKTWQQLQDRIAQFEDPIYRRIFDRYGAPVPRDALEGGGFQIVKRSPGLDGSPQVTGIVSNAQAKSVVQEPPITSWVNESVIPKAYTQDGVYQFQRKNWANEMDDAANFYRLQLKKELAKGNQEAVARIQEAIDTLYGQKTGEVTNTNRVLNYYRPEFEKPGYKPTGQIPSDFELKPFQEDQSYISSPNPQVVERLQAAVDQIDAHLAQPDVVNDPRALRYVQRRMLPYTHIGTRLSTVQATQDLVDKTAQVVNDADHYKQVQIRQQAIQQSLEDSTQKTLALPDVGRKELVKPIETIPSTSSLPETLPQPNVDLINHVNSQTMALGTNDPQVIESVLQPTRRELISRHLGIHEVDPRDTASGTFIHPETGAEMYKYRTPTPSEMEEIGKDGIDFARRQASKIGLNYQDDVDLMRRINIWRQMTDAPDVLAARQGRNAAREVAQKINSYPDSFFEARVTPEVARGQTVPTPRLESNYQVAQQDALASTTRNTPLRPMNDNGTFVEVKPNVRQPIDGNAPLTDDVREAYRNALENTLDVGDRVERKVLSRVTKDLEKDNTTYNDVSNSFKAYTAQAGLTSEVTQTTFQRALAKELRSLGYDSVAHINPDGTTSVELLNPSRTIPINVEEQPKVTPIEQAAARYNTDSTTAGNNPYDVAAQVNHQESTTQLLARISQEHNANVDNASTNLILSTHEALDSFKKLGEEAAAEQAATREQQLLDDQEKFEQFDQHMNAPNSENPCNM